MAGCYDPECSGTAEPEQDGDLTYLVCEDCGYEFGYELLTASLTGRGRDTCAVGIPEAIRRVASAPPPGPHSGRPPTPLLQIGRRP